MSSERLPRPALLQMIAGAALISTSSIFVRLAHVGPTVSAFYRVAFGGLFLLVGLLAFRRWQRLRGVHLLWMLAPALAFALDLMLWHRSILRVGPGLATLLANFQVFVMALAGWLLHRERLHPPFLFGVALAFSGLYLLVGLDWPRLDGGYRLGVALGLLTGIAYAIYMLSMRQAQRSGGVHLHAAQWLCVMSLQCAGLLGLAILFEGDSLALPDLQTWSALLGLALVGQVFGWILLLRAIPQLPASIIGLLLLLQPAMSFMLDVLLFQRPTALPDWIGVGLCMLGIFIGSHRPERRSQAHEEAPA
ncbi:DMT family transporter [Dokdonella immobilis]|uniref:Threonine/homoserine efflux transporter RhtA n=1 Tax=Dokdonella immobilis TaxID=578942 RepID=A0A1I4Z4N1_9GAMM|nr:DMT family transporter [Dokdonella immobilis]SFN45158.1 Threonine/homoserine efflux transporter RhtA [Dokdonella immobilis]